MTDQPKAAIIQISCLSNFEQRLQSAETLCRQAAKAGAQLLVLPENFAYYGSKNLVDIADRESTATGPVHSTLLKLAKELGVWIVGGTLPLWPSKKGASKQGISKKEPPQEQLQKPPLPHASTLVIDPQGNLHGRYDKIHLFDVDLPQRSYRESDSYSAGSGNTLVFDSPVGKVGVLICFDLRFPNLALELRNQGADIIVAPSAFTRETGKPHWQLLLQARALDSQCYVLGANLTGQTHIKPVWGNSTAVDPWGQVFAEMDDNEGFLLVPINLDRQQQIRETLPLSTLRRI